jgi:hypothetical protein
MNSRYPPELRRYVLAARKRGDDLSAIAAHVRRTWPAFPDFSAHAAGMMVGGSKPRDYRTHKERRAVPINLGGPAWSRPKPSRGDDR